MHSPGRVVRGLTWSHGQRLRRSGLDTAVPVAVLAFDLDSTMHGVDMAPDHLVAECVADTTSHCGTVSGSRCW